MKMSIRSVLLVTSVTLVATLTACADDRAATGAAEGLGSETSSRSESEVLLDLADAMECGDAEVVPVDDLSKPLITTTVRCGGTDEYPTYVSAFASDEARDLWLTKFIVPRMAPNQTNHIIGATDGVLWFTKAQLQSEADLAVVAGGTLFRG